MKPGINHNKMTFSNSKIPVDKIGEKSVKVTDTRIVHGQGMFRFHVKEQTNKIRDENQKRKSHTRIKRYVVKTLDKHRLKRFHRNKSHPERRSTESRNKDKDVKKTKRYLHSDYYVWDDRAQSDYEYGEYEVGVGHVILVDTVERE